MSELAYEQLLVRDAKIVSLAAKVASLEAENARLKEEIEQRKNLHLSDGEVMKHSQQIIEGLDTENARLSAALRRAYRKSEVLDEPCFVTLGWAHAVCEGDPDFDTIKSAFEAEAKEHSGPEIRFEDFHNTEPT